jgi:hypothetical protein
VATGEPERQDDAHDRISGVAWRQEDLFGDSGPQLGAEPVLMALHAEYYELIWRGLKTHEFRRRFLEGRPAR